MEISSLSSSSIKLKGKQATIVVDPSVKTSADIVLLLNFSGKLPAVEGQRLLIQGAGEYEVGGLKVSASGKKDNLVYTIIIDGVDVCLSTPDGLKSLGDKLKESHIVVLNVKTPVDGSQITALAPSVVLLYGDQAVDGAKALGKEAAKASKYATTLEKLPSEMEVITLG